MFGSGGLGRLLAFLTADEFTFDADALTLVRLDWLVELDRGSDLADHVAVGSGDYQLGSIGDDDVDARGSGMTV